MIYITCFLASVFFAWLASRSRNFTVVLLCSAISILILCTLGGLRHETIGTDVATYAYPDYITARSSLDFTKFLEAKSYKEVGYLFICYFAGNILGHLNWTLFFYQLVTMTCLYVGAYRMRKQISLPFFLLIFCLMRYNQTYNIMRQMMACSVIFMGFPDLQQKKYLKFSLFILVASLFHTSAVVNFPLTLCVHMVMSSKTVLRDNWLKFFILISLALILFRLRPILMRYINYLPGASIYSVYVMKENSLTEANNTSVTQILVLATTLLATVLYRKQADKVIMPSGGGGVNFFQFNLIFCILYYSAVRLFATRILLYAEFLNFIVLSAMPRFVREKHFKVIVATCVLSVSAFMWWLTYVHGGGSQTWPYKSIL